jgi:hypothetical protein
MDLIKKYEIVPNASPNSTLHIGDVHIVLASTNQSSLSLFFIFILQYLIIKSVFRPLIMLVRLSV